MYYRGLIWVETKYLVSTSRMLICTSGWNILKYLIWKIWARHWLISGSVISLLRLEFGYNTIFSARIQLRFVISKVRLEKSQLVGITNTYCDIIFLPRFVNHFLIGQLIYLSDWNIEGFHLIQVSPTIWDHPFKTSAFITGEERSKIAKFADG